jgi:hypothetical protein
MPHFSISMETLGLHDSLGAGNYELAASAKPSESDTLAQPYACHWTSSDGTTFCPIFTPTVCCVKAKDYGYSYCASKKHNALIAADWYGKRVKLYSLTTGAKMRRVDINQEQLKALHVRFHSLHAMCVTPDEDHVLIGVVGRAKDAGTGVLKVELASGNISLLAQLIPGVNFITAMTCSDTDVHFVRIKGSIYTMSLAGNLHTKCRIASDSSPWTQTPWSIALAMTSSGKELAALDVANGQLMFVNWQFTPSHQYPITSATGTDGSHAAGCDTAVDVRTVTHELTSSLRVIHPDSDGEVVTFAELGDTGMFVVVTKPSLRMLELWSRRDGRRLGYITITSASDDYEHRGIDYVLSEGSRRLVVVMKSVRRRTAETVALVYIFDVDVSVADAMKHTISECVASVASTEGGCGGDGAGNDADEREPSINVKRLRRSASL